ncbi:MAG: replication-associated recombination protein A [Mariprofundaceae bacterium]|nr:replication-associated recombination protein A [Mariprofundaceae bacterium]
MNTLFDALSKDVPLAYRLRPKSLQDVQGQQGITNDSGWFAVAIREKRAVSCIFWGPPGVGKTTLATLMAESADMPFVMLSAVSAGKKEVQAVVAQAQSENRSYLLFLDEIHRFNKAQQDVLLPYLEDGTLILLGATTENPSFNLNNALLSRCRVVVLNALEKDAVLVILQRGLKNLKTEYTRFSVQQEALQWLATAADGDARYALNALQALIESDEKKTWTLQEVQQQWMRRQANYDRDGDGHYDLISALHKSIRSSDADASCYWLARMLEAGDEPLYLARRLIRIATEDVGLADPRALSVCMDAQRMFEFLGSPEGEQGLFEAAIYLALAPKSNAAYLAEKAARKLARESCHLDVPMHLKNAPTTLMKELGHGEGYQYAHHAKDAVVDQSHFPDALGHIPLFEPTQRGFERILSERMIWLDERRKTLRKESKT